MASAAPAATEATYHIGRPEHTEFTQNLLGYVPGIIDAKTETRERLRNFGINQHEFAKHTPGTRFNLNFIRHLSRRIGELATFRMERMKIANLAQTGGETQMIKTRTIVTAPGNWKSKDANAISVARSSAAHMGIAYCYGFQLYKENTEAELTPMSYMNWSCVTGMIVRAEIWQMPDAWDANKNQRRHLPAGIDAERFRAAHLNQDNHLQKVVTAMVKTTRSVFYILWIRSYG